MLAQESRGGALRAGAAQRREQSSLDRLPENPKASEPRCNACYLARFATCTTSQSLTVEATRWSFASRPSTQRITVHTNRPRQDLLPRRARETRFSALPPLKSACARFHHHKPLEEKGKHHAGPQVVVIQRPSRNLRAGAVC